MFLINSNLLFDLVSLLKNKVLRTLLYYKVYLSVYSKGADFKQKKQATRNMSPVILDLTIYFY